MKKSIYQPPNIELRFKLIEFHRFWWICVSTGVYQEKKARYQGCQSKKHIPPWNQVKKDLEDTRRRPTERGPPRSTEVSQPHPRSADPRGSHLSASSVSRFSTVLGFASSPLIKVDLIWGLWFIPLAYISQPLPHGFKAFKSFDQVIRARNPSFLRAPPYCRA
jgi:hypothetical protein